MEGTALTSAYWKGVAERMSERNIVYAAENAALKALVKEMAERLEVAKEWMEGRATAYREITVIDTLIARAKEAL